MKLALRVAAPLAGLCVIACGTGGDPGPAPVEPFVLREVVQTRLAALRAELGPEAPLPTLAPDDLEELEGLVSMVASARGKMRDAALEGALEVGIGAVPFLAGVLADDGRPSESRMGAADMLAALDHPAASAALALAVETAAEPWLRRYVAWCLSRTSEDRFVARLVLRLKYEKDHEAFVWLASTLAHFRCYAGIDALSDLTAAGESDAVRALAISALDRIAAEAGVEGADALVQAWHSEAALELPRPARSGHLELALWTLVTDLSEEHFQLRGVDDARYVLSRLGPWAAEPIAAALHDADIYVRLHCAQVLQRMGPHAVSAGPTLIEALHEPRVAPAAAEALGSSGYASALEALLACTVPGREHELRVAALRGVGATRDPVGAPRVRALFEDESEPTDLRMAAATALVRLEAGAIAAGFLTRQLANETVDPGGAEVALEEWLVFGASVGADASVNEASFLEALEAWSAAAPAPGVIHTPTEARARRARRASELEQLLPELLRTAAR